MANEYKKVISDKKKEAGNLMTSKQLKKCNTVIHIAALAAGASGMIPIPVMDSIPISAAQVTMVIALGEVFDQKITESVAKGVIGAAASTSVGRSLVKLLPIGWIASATVAVGVTEAIGWSIAVDFVKMSKSRRVDDTDDIVETEECEEKDSDDESVAKDFAEAMGEEEE